MFRYNGENIDKPTSPKQKSNQETLHTFILIVNIIVSMSNSFDFLNVGFDFAIFDKSTSHKRKINQQILHAFILR